jgi:hypothetical protein
MSQKVRTVLTEEIWEVGSCQAEVRLWNFLVLFGQVCASSTDDRESWTVVSVEACCADNRIELEFYSGLGENAFLGEFGDVVPPHIDVVATQRFKIALPGRLSTAANWIVWYKHIIDFGAFLCVAQALLHCLSVQGLSELLSIRSGIGAGEVSASTVCNIAAMPEQVFRVIVEALQSCLGEVQLLIRFRIAAGRLVDTGCRRHPCLGTNECRQVASHFGLLVEKLNRELIITYKAQASGRSESLRNLCR